MTEPALFALVAAAMVSQSNFDGTTSALMPTAMYTPALVPISLLLAMLSYVPGTVHSSRRAVVPTQLAAMMG